jgi:hypothetical protein
MATISVDGAIDMPLHGGQEPRQHRRQQRQHVLHNPQLPERPSALCLKQKLCLLLLPHPLLLLLWP